MPDLSIISCELFSTHIFRKSQNKRWKQCKTEETTEWQEGGEGSWAGAWDGRKLSGEVCGVALVVQAHGQRPAGLEGLGKEPAAPSSLQGHQTDVTWRQVTSSRLCSRFQAQRSHISCMIYLSLSTLCKYVLSPIGPSEHYMLTVQKWTQQRHNLRIIRVNVCKALRILWQKESAH